MQNKEYSVLYTHQKTKKHKTWQDGSLLFQQNNNKVILYDEQKTLLDSLFIASGQLSIGMDLESDRYLITIEEEKNSTANTINQQFTPANDTCSYRRSFYPQPSIKRKGFQPPKFIASEKRVHQDITTEPPDKKFKSQEVTCSYNGTPSQMASKPSSVTRDQFFSLYSGQRHHSLQQKTNLSSHSANINQTTTKHANRNKRNSSQILALFSSSNNQNQPAAQYSSSAQDKHTSCSTNTANLPFKHNSNNLKNTSLGVALNRSNTLHPDMIVCEDKENRLQEDTALPLPLFGSDSCHPEHYGSDSLFSDSKMTYNTTPYLEEPVNRLSDWEDASNNQMFMESSCVPYNGDKKSVMDLFQVPDVDLNAELHMDDKDISDDFTSEFYTTDEKQDSCFSTQSEQEKADILSNWRGSLTSSTVIRKAVVPSNSQFPLQNHTNPSATNVLRDKIDWSWTDEDCGKGISECLPSTSVGSVRFSQRVPQLSKRKREPMTSCPPTNNSLSKEPEAEVPNNTVPHLQSCKAVLIHDGIHDNLSRVRRIGLSKPGRSADRGLLCKAANTKAVRHQDFEPKPYRASCSATNQDSMTGELVFPSSKECIGSVKPCRQVTLPVNFANAQQYKQILKAALREHLNIILFELAETYHAGLGKVSIEQYSSLEQDTSQEERPKCSHGVSTLRAVKKDGPNKGRLFYCCPGPAKSQCKLFKWANECKTTHQTTNKGTPSQSGRPSLSTAEAVTAYFKSQNVSLYCECHLVIKRKNHYSKKFGKNGHRYSKKNCNDGDNMDGKTTMYVELCRRERSTAYSRDDIWIISSSLIFDKHSTFVAKSTYFGPYANGELEISPISGYSPSKWHSGDTVFALHGCNAGSELMCIENIDNHVNNQTMPLLPQLLSKQEDSLDSSARPCRQSTFVPPTRNGSRNVQVSADIAFQLAEETIVDYHLNLDQGAALYDCAGMFTKGDNCDQVDISLIHGVFGAGKSYLLAVMILYLVKVFSSLEHQPKILVSSTTNVAVDRILLGLLELGFEDFIRVGSVRKIAKRLLPYSMHGSGSSSEEIKELKAMLKDDLDPSERLHIQKSIEQQRQGGNKQRLTGIPVVGVTCAACVFPCLEKMKFSVLLLDECSQMTEPATLLPLARFGCQKLVLVGDPKQLSPTIQGSQPEHDAGLEQTLFNRLVKMGYQTTLLRTQYRCHPVISAVANRLFYDGNLRDGVSEEDRAPLVDFAPTLCFYDVTRGKEKCGQDGSYYNEEEAKFIVFLIGCFMMSGLEPAQIGVITLYKSQLRTISSCLAQSGSVSYKQLKSVQISTVDAFQGGEKDIILLSCVRTDHVGFIDCDRRTNVALTRAKRHLLIVGNQRMLSSNKMWRNVIQHCKAQQGGVVMAKNFQQSWQNDLDTREDTKGNEEVKNTSSREPVTDGSRDQIEPVTDESRDQTEPVTQMIIESQADEHISLNKDNHVNRTCRNTESLDGSESQLIDHSKAKEYHEQFIDDSLDMLFNQREEFHTDDGCLLSVSAINYEEKQNDTFTHEEQTTKEKPQPGLHQQPLPKSGHSSPIINSEEFICQMIPESSITDDMQNSSAKNEFENSSNSHSFKGSVDFDFSSMDNESGDIALDNNDNDTKASTTRVSTSMGDEDSDDELPFFDILSAI